ncbi:eCIS core domain-containing protein [Hyalangium sp.]|uniref:eCIS core domain-containing protein n=1 Tax=Hyalangium sp. TaxID=2028555 RepID=UPI002D5D0F7E|nr:DUF4157 domain-containing protein [Hyalangium sp.]HYI02174.1 DUF4157 domain-containing protein [Hyalangium sp.]
MKIQTRTPPQTPARTQEARNELAGAKAGGASGALTARRAGFETVSAFSGKAPDVQSTFRRQFGELAADKQKFHDTLRTVFGEGYDAGKAEQFRKQAQAGNFDWLPPVKRVSAETLGGANGAYDAESGTVLLNESLDPSLAASTYVEEAGHHLDAQLNSKDSAGDEGELFRRVLSGEKLSSAQVGEIRAENDKGIVYVDGQAKEVEFWNPFKAIGNAAKAVGNAIGSAAKAVGNAVGSAAKAVGNVVKGAAERVGDGVRSLVTGVASTVVGAVRNVGEGIGTFFGGVGKLFTGDFKEGLKQMGSGLLKTFVQTPVDALLLMGGRALSAVQTLIGVEPPGRKLTGDEVATLRQVYGDSIDYSQLRIKEGSSGLFSTSGRAFTHGNTIYIPPENMPMSKDLLVHESAHVWQHQNGGTDYMSEALVAQYLGDGYDFEKGLREGKSWSQLNPEQQAEFLQQAQLSGYFDNPGRRFEYNGTDYTAQLEAALQQVRAGQGAP